MTEDLRNLVRSALFEPADAPRVEALVRRGRQRRIRRRVTVLAMPMLAVLAAAAIVPRLAGQDVSLVPADDRYDPQPPRVSDEVVEDTGSGEPPWMCDNTLLPVAQAVPTFAGLYLEGGTIVVRVTDGTSDSAERARQAHLATGSYGQLARRPVRAESAQYSWLQLCEWQQRLMDELSRESPPVPWTMTSVDIRCGCVYVGVEDSDKWDSVIEAAGYRAGIPPDALVVEDRPAPEPLT